MKELQPGRPRKVAKGRSVVERRRHRRVPICAWVIITRPDHQKGYLFTMDVSKGGIFVVSDESIPVGTELGIELVVNEHFQFKTSGRVVRNVIKGRSRNGKDLRGFAVELTELSDGRAIQLMDLIETVLDRMRPGSVPES